MTHLNSQTLSCHQCSVQVMLSSSFFQMFYLMYMFLGPPSIKYPFYYQVMWCGTRSTQQGAPHRGACLTHLLCSRTLDCLSSDTSGLKLLSLLVRLQMWLRSSCSLCLLVCSSDFSLLSSCSSLKGTEKAELLKRWSQPRVWALSQNTAILELFCVVTLSWCGVSLWPVRVRSGYFAAGSLLLLCPPCGRGRSVCAASPGLWRGALCCSRGFASKLVLR